MQYRLSVNGREHRVDVEPDTPLLWVLRDELGLTGTKYGCGIAQCGACTVHLEGQPVRSCVVPMRLLGERAVTTIEGVTGKVAEAVQASWEAIQVPQCGYCQSGQIMTTIALLEAVPRPDDDDVGVSGGAPRPRSRRFNSGSRASRAEAVDVESTSCR